MYLLHQVCCGVVLGQGAGLGTWHRTQPPLDDPALSPFFILGIFVRIAE